MEIIQIDCEECTMSFPKRYMPLHFTVCKKKVLVNRLSKQQDKDKDKIKSHSLNSPKQQFLFSNLPSQIVSSQFVSESASQVDKICKKKSKPSCNIM
jgi:hypothetical protein